MYGLMKACGCSRSTEERRARRLHYCGTCKTMGRLYGQRSRFLLNNDAVFFGELLTALTPNAPTTDTWAKAYQSYNCFSLPDAPEEMPLSLQIAASATLVMSEFKVADQIADGGNRAWGVALRVYSQGFQDASKRLQDWGFPVREMWDWYTTQNQREAAAQEHPASLTTTEVLDLLSEPTGIVTGLVFRHGAETVGAPSEAQAQMERIGLAFGRLVYVLDAAEDYEQDVRKGEFNALRAAFDLTEVELPDAAWDEASAYLHRLAAEIRQALHALSLPQGQAAKYAARLETNLRKRLGEPEPTTCATKTPARSLKERWKSAVELARSLQARQQEAPRGGARLVAPFAFAGVTLVALLAPRLAMEAASSRECLGLAFNLMFFGAVVTTMLQAPKRLIPAHLSVDGNPPPGQPEGITRSRSVRRVRRVRADGTPGGGCCCCDSCDCACCCCEGIECGECCCSSCCDACGSGGCDACNCGCG
ncbi:MAG TPA: DUF5685 family protein [Chthonomonadaceae bacterium]|nr:DUF5685 family protein [Chthonomonadaceae bacterium]